MKLPTRTEWAAALAALDERGHAVLPGVLDPASAATWRRSTRDDAAFRSRVVMARHNFGSGEYKYLRYPLPPPVAALRQGSTRIWRRSPISGTSGCAWSRAFRPGSTIISTAATPPGSSARRR